jgi:hypothetical protein
VNNSNWNYAEPFLAIVHFQFPFATLCCLAWQFNPNAQLHSLLLREGISFKPSYRFLLHAQLHGLLLS